MQTSANQPLSSWRHSLAARNRSEHTNESYLETAGQFLAWSGLADPAGARSSSGAPSRPAELGHPMSSTRT